MHGNIPGQLLSTCSQTNQNSNAVVAVYITTDNRCFQDSSATGRNILTNLLYQSFTIRLEASGHQDSDIGFFGAEGGVHNSIGEALKTLITSSKISFAVNFQQQSIATFRFEHNNSISSCAACFLGGLHPTGLAQLFNCLINISTSFSQCSLAFHHA